MRFLLLFLIAFACFGCGGPDELIAPRTCDLLVFKIPETNDRLCFYACPNGDDLTFENCTFVIKVDSLEDVRRDQMGT